MSKNKDAEQLIDGVQPDAKFSGEKILTLKRYAGRVDLLRVLLQPAEQYTFSEVDSLIDGFLKGKVN